jgi:hypothetical protein
MPTAKQVILIILPNNLVIDEFAFIANLLLDLNENNRPGF